MNIQLLAMDLDGTSLQPDHQSFSPRLHQALADAHAQGVIIVPTTGRQHFLLPSALHTGASWEDLCILCNGGEVRRISTGQLILGHYISAEAAQQVVELAGEFDLPVELSAGGHMYLTARSLEQELALRPYVHYHLDLVIHPRGVVVDNLAQTAYTPGLNIDKINFPHIPDHIYDAFTAQLAQLPINHFRSGPHTVELSHPLSTKGDTLLEVCRMLDISPAHAMSMGDNGNDISMLRATGFSVAMGNAAADVQAAAKAVTLPYDQDGAAVAIERYILHR